MIQSLTLVVGVIVLLLLIFIFIMTFTNARTITELVEYNEAEFARQEMLARSIGVDEEGQKAIVKVLMHASRNRIGMALLIEGKTPLDHVKDSGDSAGIIDVNEPMLTTLIESKYANRGAILIRKGKIVAFNGKMSVDNVSPEEYRELALQGLGNKHLGAFGEVRKNKGSVAILVSGDTGKISLMGYLSNKLTVDVGLGLKEFDIRGGVSQTELEYRLNDLLVGQGIDASLESVEVAEDIARKKETREERKARIKREKEVARLQKEQERERTQREKEEKREAERRAKSPMERGRYYKAEPKGEKATANNKKRRPVEGGNVASDEERPVRRRRRG